MAMAGGADDSADMSAVNLAALVADGGTDIYSGIWRGYFCYRRTDRGLLILIKLQKVSL